MAQEQLQLIITADNKDALKAIEDLAKSTEGLKYKFQQSKGATDQATQALVNLSRVAQDAPYGFMGIANNLNPLLESFQRLNSTAKDTGTSLGKELKNALIGPAGLGLALGVVSSLFVKFGDDILDFINNKINGLGEAFNKETEVFKKSGDAYVKASTDIDKLKNSFEDYQNGLITKDKFLKEFNSTLGDTIGKTNDLATAEKFLNQYADTYIEMTLKKSVANLAAAEAAKKLFEIEQAKSKPQEAFKGAFDFTTIFFGGTIDQIKDISKARQNTLITEAQNDVNIFKEIQKKYDKQADELKKSLTNVFGAADISRPEAKAKKSKLKFEDVSLYDADIEKQIREENKKLGLYQEGYKNILGDTFGKQDKQQSKASFKSGMDEMNEFFKETEKNFDEANKKAKAFAETLASGTTNAIRGMWESMKKGENILDSLGNAFLNLAEDIAFALLKMQLLAYFQTALGIGTTVATGGAAGGTGILTLLGKLFGGGMAEGGIVTSPTLTMVGEGNEHEAVMPLSKLSGFLNTSFNAGAMTKGGANSGQFVLKGSDLVLALQRSNTNLNLRRGI